MLRHIPCYKDQSETFPRLRIWSIGDCPDVVKFTERMIASKLMKEPCSTHVNNLCEFGRCHDWTFQADTCIPAWSLLPCMHTMQYNTCTQSGPQAFNVRVLSFPLGFHKLITPTSISKLTSNCTQWFKFVAAIGFGANNVWTLLHCVCVWPRQGRISDICFMLVGHVWLETLYIQVVPIQIHCNSSQSCANTLWIIGWSHAPRCCQHDWY